ncbi:MAG: hypothetical protein ACM3WV_03450 [Bacillota bacterium]
MNGESGPLANSWGFDGGLAGKGEPVELTDIDTYFAAMSREGGFNLYRWSANNCCLEMRKAISEKGNKYLREGQWGDILCAKMRQYGLRVRMDFFGWTLAYTDSWNDPAAMNAVKRYIDY